MEKDLTKENGRHIELNMYFLLHNIINILLLKL